MRYYTIFKNGKPVVEHKSLFVFTAKYLAVDMVVPEKETVEEVTITKKEEV